MNWKIERDPFYKPIYEILGEEAIVKSGFFYDKTKENFDIESSLNIHCTPMDYVRANLHKLCPAILITSGSFNPIHDGHIEMMEVAKKAIEERGFTCIGGFIAPDHDDYIQAKLGDEALLIHERIKLINDAVQNLAWLNVDCWAGIFQSTSINFTDIVYRMELYIEKHFGVKIPVFFVCGGDNSYFAKAFVCKGNVVVVSRPTYEPDSIIQSVQQLKRYFNSTSNIFFVENNNSNSSTQVRKTFVKSKCADKIVLRMDVDSLDFLQPFDKRFSEVEVKDIQHQREDFKHICLPNTVSLDPFISATYNLGVSRLYDIFGITKLGYTERPDYDSFEEQIKHIGHINLSLFDDDIATGGTMKFVTDLLAKYNHKVVDTFALTYSEGDTEIVDIRDFIYESFEGGLVIKTITRETKRVPYVYPFVCPHIRASIPDPMQFSIEIWELNVKYHEAKGNFQLAKECQYYLNLLQQFI